MRNNSTQQQEMFSHYQSWQQSGLSQIGFCILHGITFHKFNYWVRKFDSRDTKGRSPSAGFLSVAIKQPAADCKVEIIRLDGTYYGDGDNFIICHFLRSQRKRRDK